MDAVDAATWSLDAGTCAAGLLATEAADIDAPATPPMGGFGSAIAVSADGTRVLVAAPYAMNARGAVWVYVHAAATWSIEATWMGAEANDRFGTSVAISADGTHAIVGATRGSDVTSGLTGYATVFVRSASSWAEEATLRATEPDQGFGAGVAIDEGANRVLIGAPPVTAMRAGSAHVFSRSGATWSEEATFAGDLFGIGVALDGQGDRALVGASGVVRVMARSGSVWASEATLDVLFGEGADSLALDATGTVALVGASQPSIGPGTAVFLRRSGTTWNQEMRFVPPCQESHDELGAGVAVSSDGTRALIGAPGADTSAGSYVGSTWSLRFDGSGWVVDAVLRDWRSMPNGNFGNTVAISGDGSLALATGGAGWWTPMVDRHLLAFALRP